MRMTEESKPKLFCSRPFQFLEIATHPRRGDAYMCCPTWLPPKIGNVLEQNVSELWNGETARAVRRSIHDGSFKYCTTHCPWLQTASGPVQKASDVTDPELRRIIDEQVVEIPSPAIVNCAFDRSCNLACPTCRPEHNIEREAAPEIRQLQRVVDEQILPQAEQLYVTGSGDAFGSPFFFKWLRQLDVSDKPKLRIHLHSNAQLWTPTNWAKLPPGVREIVSTAEISIDAASERTYLLNRRGGSWSRLLENLEFISGLRASGPLTFLRIHMLVQENNFDEMPAFVALGQRIGADHIYFSHLVNWGTFTEQQVAERSIHLRSHPRHGEFLEMLEHPALADPRVDFGNLSEVVRAAA
jgi:Radical SAM superfamily/Iron-sulfur cluster-binding domain